jgi:uncharacterized membrane protein YedE/YeeE
MNLVPLIDLVGESGAAVVGGVVLGLLFGFFAQRSAYCTRSAVLDLTRGRNLTALAIWAAGFAIAILGVQMLLTLGLISATETRFFSTAQSLSGAIIGGLAFGFGMVLTRGCVSRLLVLGSSGNLRAIFSIVIIAAVGLATYGGVLVPLRDTVGGLWSTAQIGGNDLLADARIGQSGGVIAGIVLLAAALALAMVSKVSPWRFIGGAGVGATVVAGWYFTYSLSTQVFDPIQAESLSFIRPLATTGEIALGGAITAGMDQGLLIGTILGAFLASLIFRDFRVATFSEAGAPSIWRYVIGSILMGFGGILAVGCTIGAGLTGGSVLAISSLIGLAAMVTGAAIADRIFDGSRIFAPRQGNRHATLPAE